MMSIIALPILACFIVAVCHITCVASVVSNVSPARSCLATDCKNGECIRRPGEDFPQCVCYPGFIKRNPLDKICHDINECKLGDWRMCGFGRCVNTPGRYWCKCHDNGLPVMGNTYCRYNQWYSGPGNPLNPYSFLFWGAIADELK